MIEKIINQIFSKNAPRDVAISILFLIFLIKITISLFRDFLHCPNQIYQEDYQNLFPETVLSFLRTLGQ